MNRSGRRPPQSREVQEHGAAPRALTPRWLILLAGAVSLAAPGCGEAKPQIVTTPPVASAAPSASAPPAFVETPEAAPKPLRTGAVAPIEHKEVIDATVNGRHVDGAFEIIELGVGTTMGAEPVGAEVLLTEGTTAAAPLAVFAQRVLYYAPSQTIQSFVYVRRPKTDETKPIVGKIHTAAAGATGDRFSFRAPATNGAKEDAAIGRRWAESMSASIGTRTSFGSFVERRLDDLYPPPKPPKPARGQRVSSVPPTGGTLLRDTSYHSRDEILVAMDTLSGAESIQQAIQTHRPLLPRGGEKGSVAISTLVGPKLERHPWPQMLAALGTKGPDEPLAAAVPADGWFVRAKDLRALFRLIDTTEEWGAPLAIELDGRGEDRALAARYEAELGLGRGPLTRALGPEVIGELAATGSDPYAREGSDLTLIFRVKSKPAFDAGCAVTLSTQASLHGGVDSSSFVADGVTVNVSRSKDGAVRQHRASVGDLEIVSNSAGGIRRVLAALAKKAPALADEPDFRYMLARDATALSDVLAFAGDRFILEVAGPRQKIAEARRQTALAQLQTPAYAALLYGLFTGASPTSTEELTKSKLLLPSELEHRAKDPITFHPGSAPRSSWGAPSSLTPLVDLPPITDVSAAEKNAYERFAQMYDRTWAEYVDPIALRLNRDDAGLSADLRVLPIVSSSSYRDLQSQVGSARVSVPPLSSGVRLVAGIGGDSSLRRELGGVARHSLFGEVGIDWLGEWAMIGTADRPSLLKGPWDKELEPIQAPRPAGEERRHRGWFSEIFQIFEMPLFAAVQVKSTAAASIALVGLRKLAQDAAPGAVQWGEHAVYRDASIVRVLAKDNELPDGGLSIFYAMDGDVILVALREGVLRKLIDDRRDGAAPTATKEKTAGTQLVLEGSLENGAVATLAAWVLETLALDGQARSRDEAWALLYGSPETAKDPGLLRSRALDYFGQIPVPPDGGAYTREADGVHDAARGSAHAPVFPVVPVPGSPAQKTLGALSSLRVETSFDEEPRVGTAEPARSLHTRLFLRSRK